MLHTTSPPADGDSGKHSWVSLQWPRKSHCLLWTCLARSTLIAELGVLTWSPLPLILDLTWLDFLAFKVSGWPGPAHPQTGMGWHLYSTPYQGWDFEQVEHFFEFTPWQNGEILSYWIMRTTNIQVIKRLGYCLTRKYSSDTSHYGNYPWEVGTG